jgi:signal transduction histidine kinase
VSNRSASPLPVKPPNDAFLPALKIARRAHPRPLISFASEQIPPVCESCSRLTLFTDRLLKLHDRMKEKNLEFERIIQRKTELLGIAAHDLRLPLASIHTCSELLAEGLDGGASAEQIEWIESIHSVSEFMLRLLNDTLDFAMVESGTLQLRAAPGFLAAILAQSVSMSFPSGGSQANGHYSHSGGRTTACSARPVKDDQGLQ